MLKVILLFVSLFLEFYLQSQVKIDTLIYMNESENTIVIQNPNKESAQFQLSINQDFPATIEDIFESIKQIEKEEEVGDYIAAWKYIARNTFHSEPYTSENWQHDPILFLNSVGGGFCDDRASLLARIWEEQGYDAKVISLNGHVIPELYINGEWEMYDPDLYLYYEQGDSVLSVSELVASTEPIENGEFRGRRYADYYKSTADNSDETNWFLGYQDIEQTFLLPQHSELTIVEEKQTPMLIVKLNKQSTGKLKIPFVPIYATGNAKFYTKQGLHSMTDFFLFDSDYSSSNMIINEVSDTMTIYYSINPLLSIFEKKNNIEILSSKKLKIKTADVNVKLEETKPFKFYKRYNIFTHQQRTKRTY